MLPHAELGTSWRAARPPMAGSHLDSAACSRQSLRVLDAVAAHARHEAEIGGYVAEAAASPVLRQGRAALGALVGLAVADVAFVESATVALPLLLAALPLPASPVVAVVPGEWGPNLAALGDRGLRVVHLPVDGWGRVDVEALDGALSAARPDLVHLTLVHSHRGVLQPGAAVAAACARAGVPLVVDMAQAVGHTDCDIGADAVYGTSRKWLAGPRGVGFLGVRPALARRLRPVAPAFAEAMLPGLSVVERMGSQEAHVAGRVGLSLALGEHLAAGPDRVLARLAGLGRHARAVLEGAGGWSVADPADEPVAIVTLRPPEGVDVAANRARLLAEGIVTTAALPARAPGELRAPVLRVSPHLDATEDEFEALARALAAG